MKTWSIVLLALATFIIAFPIHLQAGPVFDGYFQVEQKKNANAWAAEDKKINEKLARLEKHFGNKPNII